MKRLPGGAPILIRKIRPDDKELLVRGLRELSDRPNDSAGKLDDLLL